MHLQCICKTCARVLLGPEERARFLRAFRSARLERAHRAGILKRILEACKKRRSCPYCGALNCTVKCAAPHAVHLAGACSQRVLSLGSSTLRAASWGDTGHQ